MRKFKINVNAVLRQIADIQCYNIDGYSAKSRKT